MRLNRFIASSGFCSRRKADSYISAGKIKVNNFVVDSLGVEINPEKDHVFVLSEKSNWAQIIVDAEKVVYALNKPIDYVCSAADSHQTKFVINLCPNQHRLFSVGRLDKDSQGLILLTNDGDLANKIQSPRAHIPKTYKVACLAPPNYVWAQLKNNMQKLSTGINIDGYLTAPAHIQYLTHSSESREVRFEITIFEGKNRQIRKMCQKIGLEVVELTRVAIGNLKLSDLKIKTGECCQLNQAQISKAGAK